MRVSLRHNPMINPRSAAAAQCPSPLLTPDGPHIVLGGHQDKDGLAAPVRADAESLFGPRGACLAVETGPLFVCDTGHHRLMIWPDCPVEDGQPAELLIGQRDFFTEGRNAKSEIGAATLNVPTGVAAADDILAVADAWNHRVLIWHGYPQRSNQPADVVLGQSDFVSGQANRGGDQPTAATLNWCYGLTIADGRLFVADTGNRRVLIWDKIPERNGIPADHVLGQKQFACRDENGGENIGAGGMRWPHAIACHNGMIIVADAGNNRVMVWSAPSRENGAACDFVIGQRALDQQENNGGAYYPAAETVNMPYGLAILGNMLVIADTANSRLLGFSLSDVKMKMGASAAKLAGQRAFNDKGDNRWGAPCRDSLCWPYGIAACGQRLIIADSGNNRILLWDAAP